MDRSEILRKAQEHWKTQKGSTIKRHWWQSPATVAHINETVGGQPDVPGLHASFHHLLGKKLDGCVVKRAVSVGCGAGSKEMTLVRMGLVEHFDLYEITQSRIDEGLARAKALNISDKVTYFSDDAFEHCSYSEYDLVYWNNALHHMLDVDFSIAWSLERLRPRGWFAMDDFVGPSRFQWSDRMLDYATRFRKSLPETFLINVDAPDRMLARQVDRPSVSGMIEMDPTEAADSGRILRCLKARVPDAEVINTGGAIYVVGLQHIYPNFTEVDDLPILHSGLLVDRALTELGETLYAVATGRKS